jgi:hypothetical protein
VNSAAINMGVQVSLLCACCMPRSSIAGSYGSSSFSFLRNLHTDFHSGCTNLHSHQQHIRVPTPASSPGFFVPLVVFLFTLTGVRCNLNDVLIYISFIVKDVEHFLMYLLLLKTVHWIDYSFAA